jgi:hypothetical protein
MSAPKLTGWTLDDVDIDALLDDIVDEFVERAPPPPLPSYPPTQRPPRRSEVTAIRMARSPPRNSPEEEKEERKASPPVGSAMDLDEPRRTVPDISSGLGYRLNSLKRSNDHSIAIQNEKRRISTLYDEALHGMGSEAATTTTTTDGGLLRHRRAIALDEAERKLETLIQSEQKIRSDAESDARMGTWVVPNEVKAWDPSQVGFDLGAYQASLNQREADELEEAIALSILDQLPPDVHVESKGVKSKDAADILKQSVVDTLCEQLRMQKDTIFSMELAKTSDIATAFQMNIQRLAEMTNGDHPLLVELLEWSDMFFS